LQAAISDEWSGHESKAVPEREKAVPERKAVIERGMVVDGNARRKVPGPKVSGVHCPHAAEMPAHAASAT
jgi:hypothetical protein